MINDFDAAMTKPGSSGELPLPKRNGPKTMVPLSWLGREVGLDYLNSNGHAASARGTLIDYCPMGLILILQGARTIVAYDRIVTLELSTD